MRTSHDAKQGKLDYCQITNSKNIFEAIDLGHQPPCGFLLTDDTLEHPETYYPLKLMICPESGLGQLDHIVDKNILYSSNYQYRPGISVPLKLHLKSLASETVSRLKIIPKSLVVDIGSNDGTLLKEFELLGMRANGVEPTNMATLAWKENKINTIQGFFNETIAKDIIKEYGRPKVITMTNVFAHMADLGEVMRGLCRLLDKDGVFVTESQYLLNLLEENQFDEIYHDHIRLYSLRSLVKLFSYYDIEVFDAQRINSREGSIRAYVGWKGKHPINPSVAKILKLEIEKKLFEPRSWEKFRLKVKDNRERFLDLAYAAKRKGLRFVADSCPTRGVVLVNYFGLDRSLLPYVSQIPKTEKIGKYLPGTHTPIVSNEIILKEKPDYILILAWHYADYIIKNWRSKGLKSKFIVPLPEFKII